MVELICNKQLRKIDKLVRMLQIQKQDSSVVQPEDQEKLEKLMKDREEVCLPLLLSIFSNQTHPFFLIPLKVFETCKN